MKVFKYLIRELVEISGLAFLVTFIWQIIELAFVGELRPNKFDTIIAILIILFFHCAYKKYIRYYDNKPKLDLKGSCKMLEDINLIKEIIRSISVYLYDKEIFFYDEYINKWYSRLHCEYLTLEEILEWLEDETKEEGEKAI